MNQTLSFRILNDSYNVINHINLERMRAGSADRLRNIGRKASTRLRLLYHWTRFFVFKISSSSWQNLGLGFSSGF